MNFLIVKPSPFSVVVNIRMDLKEIGINTRDWVDSALDTDVWSALDNAGLNLQVPQAMWLVNTREWVPCQTITLIHQAWRVNLELAEGVASPLGTEYHLFSHPICAKPREQIAVLPLQETGRVRP